MRELLELSAGAPAGSEVTIDFEASRDLGEALIVLRIPTPHGHGSDSRLATLSRREREVAELVAQGLSNKHIADRLCIATSTVKDHVHHIFQKTALPNRAAIAAACRGPVVT
jgi:DNA-binding NarL/FixJ family response regulator